MATKKKKEKPTCYVISPIGEEGTDTRRRADFLLIEIIHRALDNKYNVIRADKESKPGQIDSQIINAMFEADLVIANLTEQNANVFYELGIRHAASKPAIHMIEKGESIPFDTSQSRTVKYSIGHPDEFELARKALIRAVEEVESADFVVENPVTKARGRYEYQEGATTPVEKQMLEALDRMESIERRLRSVEDIPSSTALGLSGALARGHSRPNTLLSGLLSVGHQNDPNLTPTELAVFEAERRAIRDIEYGRELREDIREAYDLEMAKAPRAEGKKGENDSSDDISDEDGDS